MGKGRLVAVEGRLQVRTYQTPDGQNRTASEVVADTVRFLERAREGTPSGVVPEKMIFQSPVSLKTPLELISTQRNRHSKIGQEVLFEAQRGRKRKKVCSFCVEHAEHIDYKDVYKLRKYMSERGKILPQDLRNCAYHQRMLTRAIKRARNVALCRFRWIKI